MSPICKHTHIYIYIYYECEYNIGIYKRLPPKKMSFGRSKKGFTTAASTRSQMALVGLGEYITHASCFAKSATVLERHKLTVPALMLIGHVMF